MAILKVIRPLKVNGEILQPGEMFRTQNEQASIDRGYARNLNRHETRDILDEYTRYAEAIFNKKEVLPLIPKKVNQGNLF
ncbi:MAG: hypothetical protein NT178_09360 [Proteobacteria bacterium]|nr:hypothetical protein [Pseudomonadota bacterium]